MKPDAVPTIFDVPNPPRLLDPQRKLPQRRLLSTATSLDNNGLAAAERRASDDLCVDSNTDANDVNNNETTCVTCTTRSVAVDHSYNVSPRKVKMKAAMARQRVIICRLRKRIKNNLKQKMSTQLSVDLDCLPPNLIRFLESQSRLHKRTKKGRRYSLRDKELALSLYFCSPQAYRFCAKMFALPSKRTLQMWLAKLNVQPGFSDAVFEVLEQKCKRFNTRDKLCCVVFDEMSLKSALSYDPARDVVTGFEDFGDGKVSSNFAKSALVFMVKGLCMKWKQPLGYFLTGNTTAAERLRDLLSLVVQKLADIGLTVMVVICDQGATNQQMFKLFDITVEKPFAVVSGQRVLFMFDVPHLLKSIRNNLMKHDFEIDGHTIKWSYIKQFYECDSKLSIRLAPKITEKHLDLPPFAAMRVPLAAQVLSYTVSAALSTYVAIGKLPDEAVHTAEFIKLIDGLFDTFNSRVLYSPKPLQRALDSRSSHWTHLEQGMTIIKTLKVVGCKTTPPCIRGWQINISGLKILWESLDSQYNCRFLLTSRLNQDCLKPLFSHPKSRWIQR